MRARQSNYIITPAKVLNDDEVHSLKTLCTRYLTLEREGRNALMILLALECGLRATEVLNIQVGDFDSLDKTVYIRSLKGSFPRVLPLRKTLSDAIKRQILDLHPECSEISMVLKTALVFDISYSRLEQVWRMMRPNPRKTFHSLRHTFAVILFLRTRDIYLVQKALGHKNIENTMVYIDYAYSNSAMRKALVVGQ